MTADARNDNAALIRSLVGDLTFVDDTSYQSKEAAQQHMVAAEVPLIRIVDMLVDYHLEDARDTAAFTGLLVVMGEVLLKDQHAKAVVYRMRPSATGVRRTVSLEGALGDGFQQGRTALASGGTAYPGDAVFKAADRVTLQLHSYDLWRDKQKVAPSAPLIAVHLPTNLAKAWLVQIQRGQDATG